ncbi:MAG: hypothetical protein U0X73_00380 [Thermoanaerobaculia bacterium]
MEVSRRAWLVGFMAAIWLVSGGGAGSAQSAGEAGSPLAALELVDGDLGWSGLRLGATPPRVERQVGGAVALDRSRSFACAPYSATVQWKGLTLTLGFSKASPSARVMTIDVHFGGSLVAATKEQLIADLKARLPGVVYLAPAGESGANEESDPRPTYALPGADGDFVRLTPRDHLLLARRSCSS